MRGLVKAVKGRVDPKCLVGGELSDAGCRVSMRELPRKRVAVSLEHPSAPIAKGDPHCDFLFVAEDNNAVAWAVPIEFKSGGFDTRDVAAQLQEGAALLEKWVPNSSSIKFLAVVISGKFPKGERKRFQRQTLRFHGSSHPLRHSKCGSSLRSVIGS